MLERIYLNRDWKFNHGKQEEIVTLPHTVKELPFNYINEEDFQFVSTYIRTLNFDKSYKDKHLILTFEGVAHRAEIYLNNKLILEHFGGYDAFSVDLKDHIVLGEDNELKVVVDSKEDPRIPPFGHVVDYLGYGGIYRDVYIDVKHFYHVDNVFVKPYHKNDEWGVNIEVTLAQLHAYDIMIYREDKVVLNKRVNLSISRHEISYPIYNAEPWDLDNPNLYRLEITITDRDKVVDIYNTTFGLRTCEFRNDGFYLNGNKIKLRGLNRHQSFPYVGYAMPRSMQENDARILKNELHVNFIRTSHYPQSQYFIDECDRIGLLVFTEIPGWQHVGDKAWQNISVKSVESMIKQYRNHPSIILWGVRVNESKDNHDFYTRTNKLAKQLDSTRATGGVRCYKRTELLEDVYTYNDFIDPQAKRALERKKDVVKKEDMNHPYMVSEFNGHMHPAKNYDDEGRRAGQLYRLTRAMNEFYGDDEIIGFTAWCMFDYNTHKDFGSGDRICYHGVLDMFRNPKIASYLYESFGDKPYLACSSQYNPGDYDAGVLHSMYVYTNADEVKLFKNDQYIRSFTKEDSPFKNIPNPPILIEDFIGNQLVDIEGYSEKVSNMMKRVLISILKYGNKMPLLDKLTYLRLMLFHGINYQKGYELYGKYIGNWGSKETTYKLEGYKDGGLFSEIVLAKAKEHHIEVKVSSLELHEDHTYDVSAIRIKAVDQNNNILPYYNEPIELKATGPIQIIGPKLISFKGGYSGTYVKTVGKLGKATLEIKTPIGKEIINFEVK